MRTKANLRTAYNARLQCLQGVISCFVLCLLTEAVIAQEFFQTCYQDQARQHLRSEEIQSIVAADQADRQDFERLRTDQAYVQELLKRDLARRKRIGEIFGEGCMKEARDFAAAALVYQHGDVPEHYFQTFLWAKRAVDLGDDSQKRLMALGIDRYLVNIGHKQLFASQASIPPGDKCWCLEQVEESFPEQRRKEIAGMTLKEALEWVNSLNSNIPECQGPKQCVKPLAPSPLGTVPGYW